MSAAATAAGYLCAHGRLPGAGRDRQVDAERSHRRAESQPSRRLEPKSVPGQGESQPAKQVRTPRIEYRTRRGAAVIVRSLFEEAQTRAKAVSASATPIKIEDLLT